MTSFTLPAGTLVKFGTISTRLYPILRHGIHADAIRASLHADAGQPGVADGIYVGELMAYFAACTAFCHATSSLHAAYEATLGNFVQALQNAHGQKPEMPELEEIAAQAGLPIILEIELAEDCAVHADEVFVEAEKAERSWKLWRSVAIVREGGIPAQWIKQFYFPRLLDYKDVGSSRNPRMLEQTADSALMVGGLMQSWHKDTPGDLLLAFKKQYGRTNFSQSSAFNDTALERFFNLNAMLDPATRLLNQMSIWQDLDALAKKQEIPLG
ncbi:hypothetical protein LPB67_09225 [Undibacterium sp. Jales W-56]|uniref:hypothetical protein n=1 Tax=Undibacterium sp. Jales W-56 TaxID=2897325 RepID=UPI0021D1B9AB|nr:hypothetical protein [Undibacterium sp. Jales W-56]MCU6433948.1 hypothetical protein [Undibacterium sp. Jales W-56]